MLRSLGWWQAVSALLFQHPPSPPPAPASPLFRRERLLMSISSLAWLGAPPSAAAACCLLLHLALRAPVAPRAELRERERRRAGRRPAEKVVALRTNPHEWQRRQPGWPSLFLWKSLITTIIDSRKIFAKARGRSMSLSLFFRMI